MPLENRFKANRFNKRIEIDKTNRIGERKSLGFGDDKFDFGSALKSVDIDYLEFINYFPRRKDSKFKFVKSEYLKLLNGTANLDERYEMKLVNVEDGFNEVKITLIYSKTLEKNIEHLPLMYKLKNLEDKQLQFYVINENNSFKVCFIDIYHLAIPTKKQNTKDEYNAYCLNRYGLENLR